MDYTAFYEWLMNENNMNNRSAKDVLSRCRRVCKILQIENIDSNTSEGLNSCPEFTNKSMFIKSQLRRAVVLYTTYCNLMREKNS